MPFDRKAAKRMILVERVTDFALATGIFTIGLAGIMLGFYLALCFLTWSAPVFSWHVVFVCIRVSAVIGAIIGYCFTFRSDRLRWTDLT